MKIKTMASGSSGNLYRVSDGKTVLMLECGLPFRKIRQAFNFKLSEVDACLASHGHGDHIKAVKDVMAAGIDCYMSAGTAEKLKLSGHRLKIRDSLKVFTVGTFKIMPFPSKHDCADPWGFLIKSETETLVFLTDSAYCPYSFKGVNIWMIEANYDRGILAENIEAGRVHHAMEQRLVTSHFEFARVKTFFQEQDTSKTREIHLIHISASNGDPERFKREIEGICGCPVYVGVTDG